MSIASEISRLQQAKATLKTSIESKGVTVSSSATLDDYPDYVDAISQGGSPNLETVTKTYTPTTSQQADTITPSSGYDGIGEVDVTVNAMPSGAVALPTALASSGGATVSSSGTEITLTKQMSIMATVTTPGYVSSVPSSTADVTLRATDANFLAENIKSGVTLFGKAGSYTGGGTLTVKTATITKTSTGQTLSFSSLTGQPKYWFLRATSNVSSSGSTTYYYVTDLFYDGTNIKGNCFRIGSTRRVQNITSGISQSYSSGTLTITAGSSSGATPGQFYGASSFGYELVYIY